MTILKGWDRYNGGLDTQNDMTGTQSYFTLFEEHQVMFHVSTMLPYSNEDIQQVYNYYLVKTIQFLAKNVNKYWNIQNTTYNRFILGGT